MMYKMITLTDETILRGMKVNSMYQPNSVRCEATIDEMNMYYADARDMQSSSKGNSNVMDVFDTTPMEKKLKNKLVIEL